MSTKACNYDRIRLRAYDPIGNRLKSVQTISSVVTNIYKTNPLNQYTNITDGIRVAQNELGSSRHETANHPILVLMSDGQHNVGMGPGPAADSAKSKGTRIITIGLGNGINESELKSLASSPSDYYAAPTSDDLKNIYAQIAGSLKRSPARNLTLIDELSPKVTLIPGSFTGAPAPTVTGRTLRWQIPLLERGETRTFTYRVRLPNPASGTVCTNSSTHATYTDSNGHPADYVYHPLPCVRISNEKTDVACRDHFGDDGSIPSNPNGEAWWESNDIWVRNKQDSVEQHQNPVANQMNYIYVRVFNRGNAPATDVEVDVYAAPGATAIVWPGGWQPLGTIPLGTVPPGTFKIASMPWWAQVNGHTCFLMRIRATGDPVQHEGMVPFDNNLCQKNMQVLDSNHVEHDSPLVIRNPRGVTTHSSVKFHAGKFPVAGKVVATFTDHALFNTWMAAGGEVKGGTIDPSTFSVTMRINPMSLSGQSAMGQIDAIFNRIPLSSEQSSTIELKIIAPGKERPRLAVEQQVGEEVVGGSVFGPSAPPPLYLPIMLSQP